MYCGIGYFTVPLLKTAGVHHVHACEWNHDSVEALRRNLHDNSVEDRCTIYQGDNMETTLKANLLGKADRVLLGLLPSAERAYRRALELLRPEKGGWLHIHANVCVDEVDAWLEKLQMLLADHAKTIGRDWIISIHHIENVKSYGPRIDHLVIDVRCSASLSKK
jgi:tRNA wybutosine-synthesizing protein 3